MIKIIEDIANYKVNKNYQLDKPKGVRGRSSDNNFVKKKTGWTTEYSLREGLKLTYNWIYNQITSGSNIQKFIKK
jgi:nucleoside-diphosphate-sugar epimerase